MNSYLLLRDNRQTGPHSAEELRRLPLYPLDLVWAEGLSTRWMPASEVEELSDAIATPPRSRQAPAIAIPARKVPIADADELAVQPPVFNEVARRTPRRFQFRPEPRHAAGGLWILGLFVCLVGTAAILKDIVGGNSQRELVPAKMAAQPLPSLPEERSAAHPADLDYQNALQKETITTDTSVPVSQVSLRELRRLVTIVTNRYRSEIFGNTNDLQVKVHNGSERLLGKVNLVVEFLRADGSFLRQEHYSLYDLKPNTDKILVVPPSRKGVRVRYRLTGVEEPTGTTGLATA